jgi:prevent-host-death family protein
VGVIEAPRVKLDNGLFRTIEKPTSVPTALRYYRQHRRRASFIQGGSAEGRWRTSQIVMKVQAMTQITKTQDRRPQDAGWKLQDAKARFSELVRRARTEGPQRVTVRGHDAVVVIAADELERLLPATEDVLPFVAFMESLSVEGLDLTRDLDTGRDVVL